jgi:hypothetical protein
MQNVVASDSGRATALATTSSVLIGWFFVAVWVGLHNTPGVPGGPSIGLAISLLAPLVVFALDSRFHGPLFDGMRRLDLASLIAAQTYRIGGVFFLVAWRAGTLPAAFALPAGLGDVAVGLSAPFVAAAVAARRPGHRALASVWNIAGLADLVTAVFQGVTHSSSSLGVFAGSLPSDAVTRYPLSLIPMFVVPLSIILHLLALSQMARASASSR